eukprot:2787623-Alexandrium_andersonii.AAC.1
MANVAKTKFEDEQPAAVAAGGDLQDQAGRNLSAILAPAGWPSLAAWAVRALRDSDRDSETHSDSDMAR